MITLSVINDTATPELRRLVNQIKRPRSAYAAGAKAVQLGIWAHLDRLQARGNENGWPSQRFFAGRQTSVRKNVGVSELSDRGATVTIADPRFVHRITGGVVRPKRGKGLTIPLIPQAAALAGKGSVRESKPDLFPLRASGGGLFLVRPLGPRGKQGLEWWFKVVSSVTHREHPEEMPNVNELSQQALAAMTKAARLLLGAK